MFDRQGRFVIENFHKQNAFSSFLPGVAGEKGIPLWCFYVNRGQGVCSFGSGDKEHPIMEFSPAHVAYHEVSVKGFRTFLRINGAYAELFGPTDPENAEMHIGMNELELTETLPAGLRATVRYFILPEEKVGALLREVTLENVGDRDAAVEVLDGMPAMLTYGTSSNIMKVMTQTHKAWMQVEDAETRLPYYRLRASSEDTAEIHEIEEGNFAFGFTPDGALLPVLVDPALTFDYNLSLSEATGFLEKGLDALLESPQMTSNNVPTAFFAAKQTLAPGEKLILREAYGMAANKGLVGEIAQKLTGDGVFEEKHRRAVELTQALTDPIATRTADPVFDAYCRSTFLDNVLRGGSPIRIGGQVFYVYSRKHGDIERDYNFFTMLPEYYSQGNANFRDINQNRRSDPLFSPFVGDHNIKLFMDLIQLDGFNPLVIERATFSLAPGALEEVCALVPGNGAVRAVLEKPFTPGRLSTVLEETGCPQADAVLEKAVGLAESDINVTFGEGYWIDHWTYNLDLIESYLAVFPEREEALLFDDETYTYYESHAAADPRSKRYTRTAKGIRQYGGVTPRETQRTWVATEHGQGTEYCTSLMSKLVVLCMNKTASLDPMGMGLEMEAGKPGWYDALNGLPGLLGSSVAESCELVRLLDYAEGALRRYGRGVRVPAECGELIARMTAAQDDLEAGQCSRFAYWDRVCTAKEAYREQINSGIQGAQTAYGAQEAADLLARWKALVLDGVERARTYAGGMPGCYFTYDVTEFTEEGCTVTPKAMTEHPLPLFLEGAVRYMKMPGGALPAQELHRMVEAGPLYDRALHMFKVNASLAESSYELGRCRAFTPGWLENESIWLHMEYKYLLGLLKAGLYEAFFQAFREAGVPFLAPEAYGRSPLENSSFIASSANPNPSLRGKGFVARLSGSTAEFMEMWQVMMFGRKPFVEEQGTLAFAPQPALPGYLVDENGVDCTLLGSTRVHYDAREAVIPGKDRVREMEVLWKDGTAQRFDGDAVRGAEALRIRAGEAEQITVRFCAREEE